MAEPKFNLKSLRMLVAETPRDVFEQVKTDVLTRSTNAKFPFFTKVLRDKYFGLPENGIITVCGRTSHGKSAFMVKMALHLYSIGRNVLYITLEDKTRTLTERIIANLCRVRNFKLRCGDLDGKTWTEIFEALPDDIFFADSWGFNIEEIAEIYQTWQFRNGKIADIIFIDYVGRLDNFRDQEAIADEIKKMDWWCRTKRVPIVLGAQLNRSGVEEVGLDKIKGSGAIEECSEMVIVLRYPHQLGIAEPYPFSDSECLDFNDLAKWSEEHHSVDYFRELFNRVYYEISIGKGKNIPVGHGIPMQYWGEYYDYADWKCPNAMFTGWCIRHGYEYEGAIK